MLHEEKRKHSQEQQVSNLIVSELIKTNKNSCFQRNSKNSEVNENTHIASYIIFRKASEIHIIRLYSCDWSWLWSRYKLRVLLRSQAANESSSVTVPLFKSEIIKEKKNLSYHVTQSDSSYLCISDYDLSYIFLLFLNNKILCASCCIFLLFLNNNASCALYVWW